MSGDAYTLPSLLPHYPTAVDLADRVLAANRTWGAAADGTREPVNVAIYNEVGDIKQIVIASRDADGWYSTSESHCDDTDLFP